MLAARSGAHPGNHRRDLTHYPEREPLEKLVASRLGISSAQVLLTNGVDEAIHLLCETYLEPQDDVMVVTPPSACMRSMRRRPARAWFACSAAATFAFHSRRF